MCVCVYVCSVLSSFPAVRMPPSINERHSRGDAMVRNLKGPCLENLCLTLEKY